MKRVFIIALLMLPILGIGQKPTSSLVYEINDSITIRISPVSLFAQELKIDYSKTDTNKIEMIDSLPVYGICYRLPKSTFSATLLIYRKEYRLNTDGVFDVFYDSPDKQHESSTRIKYEDINGKKIVYMLVSNNEDTFIIRWTINKEDEVSREITRWEDWNQNLLFNNSK
jgi:hypothetical protein